MCDECKKPDYKPTLCLPNTQFPMRGNLPQREPEMLSHWSSINLLQQINDKPSPKGKWILHDGPPYANGHLHLGHALNKILKDIVIRYHVMNGYSSPYIPGWDCHGLPIEQKVGQQLGSKKQTMSALEIRKECEKYALKWVDTQREEFKRMGVNAFWDKPYLTIQPEVESGILSALGDLVRGGYVYKGLKPVYWCADCATALADAEVEYADHTSLAIYVKFPFVNPQDDAVKDLINPAVIIWTTTPWTLPANMAVALHPDFEYVVMRVVADVNDKPETQDWIVAKELVESFAKDAHIEKYEIVRSILSRDLERLQLKHPLQFDGRTSMIILGTHVTLEAGTGAVHTAPGHGMEDFVACRSYGIETVMPVDNYGRFTSDYRVMEGMSVWDANEQIVRILDEQDILVSRANIRHSYPHCWRCHKPIVYRATEQWFMRVDHDDLRQKTLTQIDSGVQWIPVWGHDRIYNMMSARPDWCLSRQRVWGVPIPAAICKKCGKSTLDARVIDLLAQAARTRGTNAWLEDPISSFLPDGFVCPECGGTEFDKESNILDVWFDSGSTHISVCESREEINGSPVDLYLEGSDQHRGWFHTSLLVSMGARKRPPYRAVLTHGFILDGKGEAMSKSKGNVIPPETIIKDKGADVLRLWVTSEDYRNDVSISQDILARVGEAYRRIRNTIRYLLGNLSDYNPKTDAVAYDKLTDIDKWILNETADLIDICRRSYEGYEFHRVYQKCNEFCIVQLSSIYCDVLKDRLYCSGHTSDLRRSAQTAQWHVASALIGVLAPILVFTSEEAFSYLDIDGLGSVHLSGFPQVPDEWRQPELAAVWKRLLEARGDVLVALEDARQNKKAIRSPLEAQVVMIAKTEADAKILNAFGNTALAELFIVSSVDVTNSSNDKKAQGTLISEYDGRCAKVFVLKAEGAKCERCWRVLPSVGKDQQNTAVCDRCAQVLRRFYPDVNSKEGCSKGTC
ncbi:isoleucine--tRNA ligase [Candidatus Sumerlaeota bacterium]|nr:isoleucine--tRNA ligase [Candidatus Sumerlaeota bacterium]